MSKRINNINDNYFDVIDNQNKAYILGFFYADGCNYDNSVVKIDLVDIEILEKMKNEMGFTGEIKCCFKGGKKRFGDKEYECNPAYRFSFRSRQISKQLKDKGCTPNKSKTMTFPNEDILPKELQRHFIRGFVDGNGTISYWIDNKNTKHKKFNFGVCGTTEIVTEICNIIDKKFGTNSDIRPRFIDRDNNNVQSALNGNQNLEKILRWLYKDSNLYLDRKYKKYLELLEQNEHTKKDKTLYGFLKPRRPVIKLDSKIIYESLSECARQTNISKNQIYKLCNKKNEFMYLDEYKEV